MRKYTPPNRSTCVSTTEEKPQNCLQSTQLQSQYQRTVHAQHAAFIGGTLRLWCAKPSYILYVWFAVWCHFIGLFLSTFDRITSSVDGDIENCSRNPLRVPSSLDGDIEKCSRNPFSHWFCVMDRGQHRNPFFQRQQIIAQT